MSFLWYILLVVLLLPLCLILGWVTSMRRTMAWQNILALTSNFKLRLKLGLRRFALSGERDYSTLPDPLTLENGDKVSTPGDFAARREEILSLFQKYVYGTLPKTGFRTSFQVIEEGEALEGKALRRQVKITVASDHGSSDALLLLYLPRQEKPAPVILGLNFRGNHTVLSDEAILPSLETDTADGKWKEQRGATTERWNIESSLARGYAVATVYSADLAPDKKDTYNSRVISLFREPEFKAVGAWAFGLSRGVDYLMTLPEVDHDHIALVGHSRLGKVALWAAANDDRVGLVISNDSGCTGASLSRGNHGETVHSICKGFPHWFCSGYAKYGCRENDLPVDQNLLLASLAPRKLYVASAEDDLWADPQGAFNSLMSAMDAYRLFYGDRVLSGRYPETNVPEHSEGLAIHVRAGWHDIQKEDWVHYLDYMDRYFGSREE